MTSLTHVWVVVDHTLPAKLQRSAKLKISQWFYWSMSLAYHHVFLFCLKNWHLKQSFCYSFYSHSHSRLMRCSSSVVNPVVVTAFYQRPFNIAANKEYLINRHIVFRYVDSAIPQLVSYIVWNCHLNWLTFLEAMQENKGVRFISAHGVLYLLTLCSC